MDSYSQALSSRRGKGLDPSMIYLGPENASQEISEDSKPQDVRKGFEVQNGQNVGIGLKDPPHGEINQEIGLNHSSDQGQRQGTPSVTEPTQFDRNSTTHLDEHTKVDHEMRDAVIGHEGPNEYQQMQGFQPRTLGERAKMMALQDKYGNSKG